MAILSSKIILVHLMLVLVLVVTMSLARPQNTIDSQETSEVIPNVGDLRKFYSSFNTYGNPSTDDASWNRLQMQLLTNSVNGPGTWDQLYRLPEVKRQVRYRQCYFNPISCFRK